MAEEPGQIAVKQARFLARGDVKPEEDETLWPIPLNLKTTSKDSTTVNAFTVREETIRSVDDSFYILNAGQKAFYRTNIHHRG